MFKKYQPTDPYVRQIHSIQSSPLTVLKGLWWVFCLVVSTGAEIIENFRSKVQFSPRTHTRLWRPFRRH